MTQRFTDRVAVVTGAGGGIGEAYARALHAEGASVVIAELNKEAGAAVAADLGERALFVHTDVGDLGNCEAMATAAWLRRGLARGRARVGPLAHRGEVLRHGKLERLVVLGPAAALLDD